MVAPPVVVLIAICCAAFVTAVVAAMHRVYTQRSNKEARGNDAFISPVSHEQANYMRDVRIRNQLNSFGKAPAYGEWAV